MHIPVLTEKILEYLDPKPNENFIDCTAGGGGHTFKRRSAETETSAERDCGKRKFRSYQRGRATAKIPTNCRHYIRSGIFFRSAGKPRQRILVSKRRAARYAL